MVEGSPGCPTRGRGGTRPAPRTWRGSRYTSRACSYRSRCGGPEMNLKCVICVDKSIGGDITEAEINTADTMAPLQQEINVGIGQKMVVFNVVPICIPCRSAMLGKPSSSGGLVVA